MALPVPQMNVINGGAHANNSIDMQEFMLVPLGAPTFREALRYGAEVFHALKKLIDAKGMATTVGDEGGFAPNLASNEAGLQLLLEAIDKAGYTPGTDIALAIDCAASEYYKDGMYELESEGAKLTRSQMVDYLAAWVDKYPIISIEDAMSEHDWDGWKLLTDRLGKRVQIVGDDIFVTSTKILKQGIARGVANSILVKINQIGTLTETFAAISMAMRAGYTAIVSHRSGRDRGQPDRRHRRRQQCRPDQDRIAVALRSHRQVQPAAADRGGLGRRRQLSRSRGVLSAQVKYPLAPAGLVFALLILALQYPLWLGKGGWLRVRELNAQVEAQKVVNAGLKERNAALDAEVRDLKQGTEAIEERARSELGMIRQDEIFFQLPAAPPQGPSPPSGSVPSR